MNTIIHTLKKHQFLLEELVQRDFKKKYKGTMLGMAWSVLNPLFMLFILWAVFSHFFGSSVEHYPIYLFCGMVVFSFFNESTSEGLLALVGNASIITKVNVPKYLFILSKSIQTLLNFGLTLVVFFLFCLIDGIEFSWNLVALAYPIAMLFLFNMGLGLILSALYVFFRDMQYLWSVLTQLVMYLSAVFYPIDSFPEVVQTAFLANPVYVIISYFRQVVIGGAIPSVELHLLMAATTAIVLGVGALMYRKFNTEFLYYL